MRDEVSYLETAGGKMQNPRTFGQSQDKQTGCEGPHRQVVVSKTAAGIRGR